MTRAAHDFDLHGVVGIRLLDAGAAEVATVSRQLGLPPVSLDREPDVVVRFADVVTRAPLTHVSPGDTGFNRDGFFLLRGRGGTPTRTRMPFDALDRMPELVCERAVPAVPHLLAVINLAALAKGVLPLHASAFTLDAVGVLVTGWSKGGKTEALLGATRRGASYVGDEWVYLTPDGGMLGLPEPIRVWGWHLEQLPELLRARPLAERTRLRAWRAAGAAVGAAAGSRLPGAGQARRAHPVAARQAYLQVPPRELFGADRVVLRGRLDAAVLVLGHTSPEIITEPAGPTEIPDRMAASLAEERAPLLAHYRQFRFAFPDLSSPLLESAGGLEAELLGALFRGRSCAKVSHPYPCDIAALGDAVVAAARTVAAGARTEGAAVDRAAAS